MAGTDRRTGKCAERMPRLRESIETLLKVPLGAHVMRHGFGFAALAADGSPKRELRPSEVDDMVRCAVASHEPRVVVACVSSIFEKDGRLCSVQVRYEDRESGVSDVVTVSYS
ncbi:GPW/gp25 family protein [Salinarimonas rosea]|uniref:GPW/gp25 family protein n=1 Tax=Salinarimonas rosea TaxID=552063 RepID=UPI00049211CC|nr:GPW/gp25 family protein [Salinarimonas rosea]